MKRIFLFLVFGGFISTFNIDLNAQQSLIYGSQAGTIQPYNANQGKNNGYGNGYGNDDQQYGNNNQSNNSWQNQYSNQYGNYNNNNQGVTNISYNGNGYSNTQPNNNSNNPFLNNYARKNKNFSAKVYKMKNGKLQSKASSLTDEDLKKTIIIFFGDWCPHCQHFLTSFAKYIPQLTSSGIKIIFVGVPSINVIQNWQNPTTSDYEKAQQNLQSFGINPEQMSQNAKSEYNRSKQQKKNKQQHNSDILQLNMPAVELVLLGDNSVLDNNAIDSLPTMLAINNGTEQFRGSADNSLDVVNFENPISMQQFQEIWYTDNDEDDEDDENIDDEEDEAIEKVAKKVKNKKKIKSNKSKTKTKSSTKSNKSKNKKSTKGKTSKESSKSSNKQVDVPLANFHTRLLNRGCDCNCVPQALVKHVRVPVQTVQPIVPQPVQQQVVCIPVANQAVEPPVKVVQQPVMVSQQPARIAQQPARVVQQPAPLVPINSEIDNNFIEEDSSKDKKCMKVNPPVLCNSKIKQRREKVRNKIENAIEKHEKNRCYCN
ncbi:MAG: redoxin domain-containing protein [Alphaproteobacteria bacterium]|nr:redoxin domain-containing protein [Alphaproteobacteria bacterium]